jgi:ATP-binding cassette subfamily B protein
MLSVPRLIGLSIDKLEFLPSTKDSLIPLIIAIFGAYILNWLLNTIQEYSMARVTQRIVKRLRASLFDRYQDLPLKTLDSLPHGELMSRVTNDIDMVSATIASSTSQLLNAVVMALGSAIMMFVISPLLGLVTLVMLPLVILLTKLIAGRSRRLFSAQQKELGIIGGLIEETMTGLRVVKAFRQEEHVQEKFEDINEKLLEVSTKAQIWSGYLMPMMNVITNLGYVLIGLTGGVMAIHNLIYVGAIASFITYSRQFVRPLNEIASTFNSMQSALAGAERVFQMMDLSSEPEDSPEALSKETISGDVRFENVSFEYQENVPILKHVTFHIEPGQTVALVGKTGAGKTTIVNLLTRFYDLTNGSIFLDGENIMNLKRESLRQLFTVVLQDSILFSGTILENIRYGKPEATREEVLQASVLSGADSYIRRLPDGYDTFVSGESDAISQGQKQLLAIARAILCPAPILILDEATSNVDSATEQKIQEALLHFRAGRTSFVIAHRLSTIRDADLILVVDDGEIREMGSHAELLAQNNLYASMVHSQMQGFTQEL